MQIIHLVDSGGMGGIERHIEVLCQAQRAQGLDAGVILIDAHEEKIWPERLSARDIPYAYAGGARRLAIVLRRYRPNLVHTHGYKGGILGRLICRVLRIPVVSSFHAGEIGAFPVSVYQRLDLVTSRLAPRIAVSGAIAAQLPEPVHRVQNFAPTIVVDVSSPLPNIIAFVGRLSIEKGPDFFCELAAAAQGEKHRWVMYGDGPMRQELESRFADCVTFRGMVREMEPEWSNIGLLVMTSRAEGLPYAALEALSNGTPLLAHAVGGLPDFLSTEPDWLLPPGDLAIAQARIAAWDRARHENSRALRERALNVLAEDYRAQAALPRLYAAYADAGVML
jgi:glycosyltransferase involved in cell wall biosynthesis